MQLTQNFTLEEFTHSQTATNHGIDNTPQPLHIANMRHLCKTVLQPARDANGPVFVSSGYRCDVLNSLIGGSLTSQHQKGEAADIKSADNARLFEWILNNCEFDQLIWEFGNDAQPQWIHVSKKLTDNRNQVLVASKYKGSTKYMQYNG